MELGVAECQGLRMGFVALYENHREDTRVLPVLEKNEAVSNNLACLSS